MNLSKAVVPLAAIFALRAMTPLQAQVPEGRYGKSPSLDYSTLSQDRVAPARELSAHRSLKRPGHYTAQDWRALIDSYWGPGPSTATKLQIFDFFWDLIDKQYAGFPNLAVNWDSLKEVYRPEIEALLANGSTQKYIASRYHTTEANLSRWLAKHQLARVRQMFLRVDGLGKQGASDARALGLAIPQFGKGRFAIEQEMSATFGQGGESFTLHFKGGWDRFKRLKSVAEQFGQEAVTRFLGLRIVRSNAACPASCPKTGPPACRSSRPMKRGWPPEPRPARSSTPWLACCPNWWAARLT